MRIMPSELELVPADAGSESISPPERCSPCRGVGRVCRGCGFNSRKPHLRRDCRGPVIRWRCGGPYARYGRREGWLCQMCAFGLIAAAGSGKVWGSEIAVVTAEPAVGILRRWSR